MMAVCKLSIYASLSDITLWPLHKANCVVCVWVDVRMLPQPFNSYGICVAAGKIRYYHVIKELPGITMSLRGLEPQSGAIGFYLGSIHVIANVAAIQLWQALAFVMLILRLISKTQMCA